MDGRYRRVDCGANCVDESLFGSTSRNHSAAKRAIDHGGGPAPVQKVVISHSELLRMRKEASLENNHDRYFDNSRKSSAVDKKSDPAGDRKERMRELEKKTQLLAKKSDSEIKRIGMTDAARDLAAEKIDSGSDVVKLLGSMSLRATAFTIRDKQLEERKQREKVEEDYDRRMDILMELDRLKDLRSRESAESARLSRRALDSSVISKQIDERQRTKLLALEAKELENMTMRSIMGKYGEEDAVRNLKKQRENEQSRREVIESNQEQLRKKSEMKAAEKREVEETLRYQALEDARSARRDLEEALAAKEKKDRQSKILAANEKSSSNADKADEIRARRAAEDKERRDRQKEKEDYTKKWADTQDLVNSRKEQALDKMHRAQRAKVEREEEDRLNLLQLADISEREEEEAKKRNMASLHYKEMLLKQMNEADKRRKDYRTDSADEGTRHRQEMMREESRLCAVRDQMVRDLEQEGINNRYLAEIKAVDIGKLLRK